MKIGITFGAFDLLHPGHILFLRECKERCDTLYVALQVDPSVERKEKGKPVQSIWERYLQLKGNRDVDVIIPYESNRDLINILETKGFDVRFLDNNYQEHPEKIIGKDIVPIEYIYRGHDYSSTELRKRLKR